MRNPRPWMRRGDKLRRYASMSRAWRRRTLSSRKTAPSKKISSRNSERGCHLSKVKRISRMRGGSRRKSLRNWVSFSLICYITKNTVHLLWLNDNCTRIRGEANHQIQIFFLQAIVARQLSPTSSMMVWRICPSSITENQRKSSDTCFSKCKKCNRGIWMFKSMSMPWLSMNYFSSDKASPLNEKVTKHPLLNYYILKEALCPN